LKKDTPKNLLPHAHINSNSTIIIGNAVNYLEKISNPFISAKRKNNENEVSDRYEEDIHEAVENYGKKLKNRTTKRSRIPKIRKRCEFV
jgi:hypothetical protein